MTKTTKNTKTAPAAKTTAPNATARPRTAQPKLRDDRPRWPVDLPSGTLVDVNLEAGLCDSRDHKDGGFRFTGSLWTEPQDGEEGWSRTVPLFLVADLLMAALDVESVDEAQALIADRMLELATAALRADIESSTLARVNFELSQLQGVDA